MQVAEYFSGYSETESIEYKQLWRNDFLKVISAFANTNGGVLHIGLDDSGNPIGLSNTKKLLEDIPNIVRNNLGIFPSIQLIRKDNKEIIIITITKSQTSISYRGKFYVRSGSTVQELTGSGLSDFLLKKMNITWDEQIETDTSMSDLNIDTIERFKHLAQQRLPSIAIETDNEIVLEKLNLIKNGYLTKAAFLLFGNNVQSRYYHASLRIGKFASESEIQETDIIDGNLFEQLENTMKVLKLKYLHTTTHFEGLHRMDVLEYPYIALREAVINALIHREYFSTSQTQLRVYKNKLIVMNDGGLPKPLLIEDLKREHRSILRNKLLAQVFYQAGFIEAWGSGTIKIREMCFAQGADEPEFYVKGGGMEVVLYPTPHDTPHDVLCANPHDTDIKVILDVYDTPHDTPHDELSSKPHPTLHNKIEISTSQRSLLLVLSGELSRTEIMERLCLSDRMHFVSSYLEPSLSTGLIERTIPEKPKSKNQKYRLTITGKRLKEKLKRKNKNLP